MLVNLAEPDLIADRTGRPAVAGWSKHMTDWDGKEKPDCRNPAVQNLGFGRPGTVEAGSNLGRKSFCTHQCSDTTVELVDSRVAETLDPCGGGLSRTRYPSLALGPK